MDLNVCMVASYFYPRGYGGNAVYELCRQLTKHGLNVHVITSNNNDTSNYQLLDDIHVHRIPTCFLSVFNTVYPISPTALNAILKIVNNNDIDLIHAHFEIFSTSLASSVAKRIARKPMVLTLHGQGVLPRSSYGTALLDSMWLLNHNTVERFAVRSADKIIALTNAVCAKARKLGAKMDRISIIPNGVDTERFKPLNTRKEYYTELNIDDVNKVVFFVGRLHPAHGILLLLHAIPKVLKVHPTSIFILVGDGPLRDYVSEFIKIHDIANNVKLLGYREDIPQLLNVAHLVVYPALSVGMPLSVLEASACAKTVIAFDIEGNREIIINNKTGFLVKDIDAHAFSSSIIHALSDLDSLKEMGQAARKFIAHNFTWERVSKKILDVYNEPVCA